MGLDSRILPALTDWNLKFGDGDAEIEITDFLNPNKPYSSQDANQLLADLGSAYRVDQQNSDWHQDFYHFAVEQLATIRSSDVQSTLNALKIKPDCGVVLGSSRDMAVKTMTVPALLNPNGSNYSQEVLESSPFVNLGLWGIESSQIGAQGSQRPRPGDVDAYIRGEKMFPAIFSGMLSNPRIHFNQQAPFQIITTPGMLLTHSERSLSQLKRDHEPGTILYAADLPRDESMMQMSSTDLAASDAAKHNPVITSSLGENELLVWDGPNRVSLADYEKALRKHIQLLKQSAPNAVIIRDGIPPAHLLYQEIPVGTRIKLVSSDNPLGSKVFDAKEVWYAFKPVKEAVMEGGFVFDGDIMSSQEYREYVDYIHALQAIEKKVCEEEGALLLLVPEDRFAELNELDLLFWGDGIHPRPTLNVLGGLARALVAKDTIEFNPTTEVLGLIKMHSGLEKTDLYEIFAVPSVEDAMTLLINKLAANKEKIMTQRRGDAVDDPPLTPVDEERAAVFSGLVVNTSGRTRTFLNRSFYIETSSFGLMNPDNETQPSDWNREGGLAFETGAEWITPPLSTIYLPIYGVVLTNGVFSLNARGEVGTQDPHVSFGGTSTQWFMNNKGLMTSGSAFRFSVDPFDQTVEAEGRLRLGLGYDPSILKPGRGLGYGAFLYSGFNWSSDWDLQEKSPYTPTAGIEAWAQYRF